MTFDILIKNAPSQVLEKLETLKTLRERPDYHPEANAYEHTKIVTERLIQTGNPDLIMAGLFHDLFKAECATINPKTGYPTSPDHDKMAAEFIKQHLSDSGGDVSFANFFGLIGADYKRVADICQQHMRIKTFEEMSEKKQNALMDMDIFLDLLIFSRADDMLREFTYKTFFTHITEPLNCNIGEDGNTDAERLQEIYYQYKTELMQKLELSEQEIFDRWSDFVTELWDDSWKTEGKTVGEFLNQFAILCMDFKIEALEEIVDAKFKAFDWANAKDFSEPERLVESERKIQSKLSRQMRLMRVPELEALDGIGHHMTLNQFISCVKSGGFIDYDGYGKYATKTQKTDITIKPSDLIAGEFRKDFTHVMWYNN